MAGTAARCSSMTIGATAVENPVSCAIIRDPEGIKKVYSDTNVGKYFKGENIRGLRLRFADKATYLAYEKLDYVASVVAVMDGAEEVTATGSDATEAVITATMTGGVITEAIEFESTNGEPAEYSMTIMIAKVGSTVGTLVLT